MRHIRTTIRVSNPKRLDGEYVRKLRQYAMGRFINAWAHGQRKRAGVYFAAVERAERLIRLLAA